MKELIVKGTFGGFFETGLEGVLWSIQNEQYIDSNGFYDMKGLNILEDRDHLTVFHENSDKVLWEGNIDLLRHGQIIHYKSNEYLKLYIKNHGSGVPQLNLMGVWVHTIPANIDLAIWGHIFIAESDKYKGILRREVK